MSVLLLFDSFSFLCGLLPVALDGLVDRTMALPYDLHHVERTEVLPAASSPLYIAL